jgi:hypothetical protein
MLAPLKRQAASQSNSSLKEENAKASKRLRCSTLGVAAHCILHCERPRYKATGGAFVLIYSKNFGDARKISPEGLLWFGCEIVVIADWFYRKRQYQFPFAGRVVDCRFLVYQFLSTAQKVEKLRPFATE